MGIPVQDLRYSEAIKALQTVPMNKHYVAMARVICEQHRSISWGVVEVIMEDRVNKLKKKTK